MNGCREAADASGTIAIRQRPKPSRLAPRQPLRPGTSCLLPPTSQARFLPTDERLVDLDSPLSRSRPGRMNTDRSRCSIADAVWYEPIAKSAEGSARTHRPFRGEQPARREPHRQRRPRACRRSSQQSPTNVDRTRRTRSAIAEPPANVMPTARAVLLSPATAATRDNPSNRRRSGTTTSAPPSIGQRGSHWLRHATPLNVRHRYSA